MGVRVDGRRVCWRPRTRRRAKWAGLHGPDTHAPPWVSTASPRRPPARGFRCPKCGGKVHDLPSLLEAIHAVRVHSASQRRGDPQGGFQRSVLKPLLWGEPPAFGGVGGTRPAPVCPRRGKRKRGSTEFLAAAGSLLNPPHREFNPANIRQ